VIKPLVGKANDGPSDAAVIKPLINSKRGIVVSSGICPKYSDIDTYWMVACSIDEAIRNNIAVGGALEEIALLDNFCWPDPIKSKKTPDGEYKLAQLVRANQALAHFTRSYATPLISGKDSMKNDYQIGKVKISIPPTVLISALGQIEDVEKAVTMDVKAPGDLVYLVGITKDELGGSEYYRAYGYIGNNVPKVSAKENKKIYQKIHQAIQNQLIASCHDLSDGGLGVALAESAFAGGYGMEIFLDSVPREKVTRDDTLLFSESQARFIITLHPQNKKKWERIIKGIPASQIGQVISKPYLIIHSLKGEKLMTAKISSLKRVWKSRLV
jgi:phosphoribosylformylglycinamidine synthase